MNQDEVYAAETQLIDVRGKSGLGPPPGPPGPEDFGGGGGGGGGGGMNYPPIPTFPQPMFPPSQSMPIPGMPFNYVNPHDQQVSAFS